MNRRKILEIEKWVAGQVSAHRLRHIRGVVKTAQRLARLNGLSPDKARLAAWLHDSGKELTREKMLEWLRGSGFPLDARERRMPGLWHPHVGAALARKKWGIKDPEVLEAVRCHTLGRPGMGLLACVLFVADFIEPGRDFRGVETARRRSFQSLTEGVLAKASMTVGFLLEERRRVHPRLVETWNFFLSLETEAVSREPLPRAARKRVDGKKRG